MGKPDSADTPNPANSVDSQNFDIDVNALYNDWIIPLDKLRSYASINSQNASLIKNINVAKEISGLIKPETTVQESRCHAFYRWIGFPVFGNEQIFNPGHDIIKDPSRTINDEVKGRVSNKPKEGFNKLSEARENFSQTMVKIFSKPGSADSGVLALSSGGNKTLRKFIVPFDKNSSVDPFDMVISNQSYQVDFNVRVGKHFTTLDQFADKNGNPPSGVATTRTHIITPFIVDARIDFSVSPQTRLVAVPFVPDSSALQIGADGIEKVRRPLIERIIRKRFKVGNSIEDAGTALKSLKQIVADFPDIKDDELIKLANDSNSILKASEQIQLNNFINIIKSMMEKLVHAQETIKEAQMKYYWFPSPAVTGPEGGCSVLGVFIPTAIDPDGSKFLVTPEDWSIFLAESRGDVNTVTVDGNAATGEPDKSAYGFAADSVTFDPDTTEALGDNNDTSLAGSLRKRYQILSDASNALQVIEMIMGDFSGFGLCDIVAIMGSLHTIPKENLLGFLDSDAQVRMKTAMKQADVSPSSYEDAQKALAKSVKNFYNLMDKIYQDIKNRGNTS